jgi:hypothetical protein
MLVTRFLAVSCLLGLAAFQLPASSQCGSLPSGTVCIYGTVNGNPPGHGDTTVDLCYNNTSCTSVVASVQTDKNGHFKFTPGALGGNWTVKATGATYEPESYTYINPPANKDVSPDPNFTLESGGGGCGCYDYCTPECCGYDPVTCCDEDPCNINCAYYPDSCYGAVHPKAGNPRMESTAPVKK